MRNEIRKFILENFMFGAQEASLQDDDSFLEKSIIDSTGILELVAFLEEKYNVTVADEELVPENLDSVTKLLNFLSKKAVSS